MAVPQWFLAWVDPTDTTFSASHQVVAEDIYSIQIDGSEGQTAILTLVLKNPRIGLLNAGRKLWIWLSWSDGTNTFPQFFGRLVGIPSNVFGNLVSLIFIAKPLDFDQQRFDAAQVMKELPWFDPVFVDSRLWDDPDAIVETRTIRWACTRGEDGAPLVVTSSDILEGEEGIEVFDEPEVPKDSVSLTISNAPLASVSVKASVAWDQTGLADLSLPIPLPQLAGFNESIYSDFPKPGAGLGGGWAAGPNSSAIDLFGANNLHTANVHLEFQNKEKHHELGDVMSSSHSLTFPVGPVGFSQILTQHAQAGLVWPGGGYGTITTNWHTVFDGEGENDDPDINIPYHYDQTDIHIAFWVVQPTLSITAEGGVIKRTESVAFTMVADVQAVLTLPDPAPTNPANPVETPGADVGKPVVGEAGTVAEAAPPIGDTSLAHYFPTPRGIQSLENRLLWARAQLRQGARVAQASWTIPFERALNLNCRKSARLLWQNMPAGQIEGKITAYQIFHNVETGHRGGTVTIGATPGHAGTVSPIVTTTNDYIAPDYISVGHFVSSSNTVVSDATAEFTYSVPVAETYAGAFPLRYEDVVLGVNVTGSVQAQLDILSAAYPGHFFSSSLSPAVQASMINANQSVQIDFGTAATSLEIDLVPITGNGFESQYDIVVGLLQLPKTVDFEAASNA